MRHRIHTQADLIHEAHRQQFWKALNRQWRKEMKTRTNTQHRTQFVEHRMLVFTHSVLHEYG